MSSCTGVFRNARAAVAFVMTASLMACRSCLAQGGGDTPKPDVVLEIPKRNAKREFARATDPSTFHIDYEQGNDANPGTKDRPWKHHPWDPEATGTPVTVAGTHTYVFKNGVMYCGALIADESGTTENPIRLTSDPSWGKGRPRLLTTKRVEGRWKNCSEEAFPEFFPHVAEKIWRVDWKEDFVPRTLYEVRRGKIIRLALAREPDWKDGWHERKGNDVRQDWWEIDECLLELKATLENTAGFRVGDRVAGTGEWVDKDEDVVNIARGNTTVTEVGSDYVRILIKELKKGEFSKGTFITNGKVRQKISEISGTHDMISHVQDRQLAKFRIFPPQYWKGGTIWGEDYRGGHFVLPARIEDHNRERTEIVCNFHKNVTGPKKYSRYYLDNIPFLLDEQGEFYFSPQRRTLFVRLSSDSDPNRTRLEAGESLFNIAIYNQSNISIDNLEFRGCNEVGIGGEFGSAYWRGGLVNASVLIRGNAENITVRGCVFEDVPFGIVSAALNEGKGDVIDTVRVENCAFRNVGTSAITLTGGSYLPVRLQARVQGQLKHVSLLDNTVYNCDYRHLAIWGFPAAICVANPEIAEIARNKTYRTGGAGIYVIAGTCPVQRILIHHNHVEDSLLALQDVGGIAFYQQGPAYIYNNVSINPVGYKHVDYKNWHDKKKDWFRTSCFGIGIYPDHGYKTYGFNNIIIGTNNDCNDRIYSSVGWNEAAGYLNTFFNNTVHSFAIPMRKGMTEANRSKYLNNLCINTGLKFLRYDAPHIEFDSLAFSNNVLHGNVKLFATVSREWDNAPDVASIDEWRARLRKERTLLEQTGWVVREPQVKDAARHDFTPLRTSKAIDNAKKVFVPWGLCNPQGEWHFYPYKKDTSTILDEHFHRTREGRGRHNLKAHAVSPGSYTHGALEDWIKGALSLNGKDQYCTLEDSLLMNVGTSNFLIETVLRTAVHGPIVAKVDDRGRGYALQVLENGHFSLELEWANGNSLRAEALAVAAADRRWHHVLAEVDRREKTVRIHVDGKEAKCVSEGRMPSESLDNGGVFTVGRQNTELLACDIDFLRIALGTLKDAETTIAELYNWEFDGPFLNDFHGRPPFGRARDVGAIEYVP